MSTQKSFSADDIISVWHFTDKSNLASIEKYGIQSLANIYARNIKVSSFGADELSHRLDIHHGFDKYVHLSFIKDHPMYHIAKKRGSLIDPVWIELDISVLLNDKTLFSSTVANKNNASIFNISKISRYIDFSKFDHQDFAIKKEARKAEIMAYDSISTKYIRGVYHGK